MYDFAEKEIVWVMAGLFAIFGTIIMGIFCEKSCSRWRGALVIGIGILLLSYGILHYITLYTSEYNENLERTLNLTQQEIANDAVVYSDLSHVTWTIGELYYTNTKQEIKLKEGDIKLEQVVSNGLLGTLKVEIYKVNMN